MTMWQIIVLVAASDIAAYLLLAMFRYARHRRYGPSKREFANAVVTVTYFMNHHNKTHPKEKILTMTISADGTNT